MEKSMSKKIKCPKCGEETSLENNEFKPFCSARCQTSDLGAWADGSYFIAGDDFVMEEEELLLSEEEKSGRRTYH